MAPHRRHFRLILPKLQWRLIGAMSAVAALALLVQYTLFVRCVLEIASSLPHDGDVLIAQSASTLGWVLVVSLAILFPILFFVAVAVSHRFCGPLYRFEKYLGAVVEGTERGRRPAGTVRLDQPRDRRGTGLNAGEQHGARSHPRRGVSRSGASCCSAVASH
jgi:hypothetical protein